MEHVIRFNGHINWAGRASGLPEVIYAFLIVTDANEAFINKLIEDQTASFIRSQAMYVQREQGKPIDLRIKAQDRLLVPFHNIAYINVDVTALTGELSSADEHGVERLENGEEPIKQ